MHREARMIHRGGERQVSIGEPAPFGEEHRSAPEIEAFSAHVPALGGARDDDDGMPFALRILLDDDRIGAARQEPAGENARRLTRAYAALKRMAGCGFA